MASTKAALGLRAHSGWAAMVAIIGPLNAPPVIDRRIIQLHNPKTAGSKQPYHAAEPLPFQEAERLVSRCTKESQQLACDGLGATIADLQKKGHQVAGCGVLLASGRPLPALDKILTSHPLIHTAEGELYRSALLHAAAKCKLPAAGVKEGDLFARAAEVLGRSEKELRSYLLEIGRSLRPPWREDQKFAMLAAWIALTVAEDRLGAAVS